MPVVFSNHALYQLSERGISDNEVKSALINPDKIVQQAENRFQAVSRIDYKYALVVIYDESHDKREIVTAFKTSKLSKYL